jgi:hypothetical protein
VILRARLHNQLLTGTQPRSAASVVARLCAMQAQDFIGAKWAIGLRAGGLDDRAVEAAFDKGAILRTHVLRPTWHFVTPADIRWLLTLTAPRVHAVSAFYYRQHGLDAKVLARAHRVLAGELADGRFLTRVELAAALGRRGIEARGPRLGLLTIHAELEQVMCSGPVRGRQLTYALFDDRAPSAVARTPRDPAGELASRFFASHGPATARDFAWWSGLTLTQAQRAIESALPALVSRRANGLTFWAASWDNAVGRMPEATFLMPNFDEYLIAYKDRHLVQPARPAAAKRAAGRDAFAHPLVVDGLLAGLWRRRVSGRGTHVEIVPDRPAGPGQNRAIQAAVERLIGFAGPGLTVAPPW